MLASSLCVHPLIRPTQLPSTQKLGVSAVRCTGSDSQLPAGQSRVNVVDNRNEIREFLASRRARLTPEQAGVPTFAGQRRVPGLRRSEVAQLAEVSIEYYIRLERGNLGVLDATATALQLEE